MWSRHLCCTPFHFFIAFFSLLTVILLLGQTCDLYATKALEISNASYISCSDTVDDGRCVVLICNLVSYPQTRWLYRWAHGPCILSYRWFVYSLGIIHDKSSNVAGRATACETTFLIFAFVAVLPTRTIARRNGVGLHFCHLQQPSMNLPRERTV